MREAWVRSILNLCQQAELEVTYHEATFSLRVEPDGHVLLGDMFSAYESAEEPLRTQIIESVVKSAGEFKDPMALHWEGASARVLPRIRARSYYEFFPQLAAYCGGRNSTPPHRPLGHWLAIGLCYDTPHQIRDVHDEHLQQWGVDFDQVMERALDNLRSLHPEPLRPIGPGLYAGPWQDHYNATRLLLLPEWVPGPCLAAVPHRDALFVADPASPEARDQLMQAAAQGVEHDHALSPAPLSWDGRTWQDWTPTDPPKALKNLNLLAAAKEYSEQQKLFHVWFKLQKQEMFVASFQFFEQPATGQLVSCSSWTEGVESLLPRTDLLALLPRGASRPKFVAWDEVWPQLRDRLLEQPGYCPRYRTVGFPGEPELAQWTDVLSQQGPARRQARVPRRSGQSIVLPLQIHLVVHPQLSSQRQPADWEKVVAKINQVWEPVGIRFQPEIAPLQVPDEALQPALPNASDAAPGRLNSCLKLLSLPEVRPNTLQIFCLAKIPMVGGAQARVTQGYLYNESLLLLARDQFADTAVLMLSRQLGTALGLAKRQDDPRYLMANAGGQEFAPEERQALRFRACRLLANNTRSLLPLSVHRVVNKEFGTTIPYDEVWAALDSASQRLERSGLALVLRADHRLNLGEGNLEQLSQCETWDEGAANLFLFKNIPEHSQPFSSQLEPPMILVSQAIPLEERLADAALDFVLQKGPEVPLHHLPLQVHPVVHPDWGSQMRASEVEGMMAAINRAITSLNVQFEAEVTPRELLLEELTDPLHLLDLPGVRPGVIQLFLVRELPGQKVGICLPNGLAVQPEGDGQAIVDYLVGCLGILPSNDPEQQNLRLRQCIGRLSLAELGPALPVHLHAEKDQQATLLEAFTRAADLFAGAVIALPLRALSLGNEQLGDARAIHLCLVEQLPGNNQLLVRTHPPLIQIRRDGPLLELVLAGLWKLLGMKSKPEPHFSLGEAERLHAAAEQFREQVNLEQMVVHFGLAGFARYREFAAECEGRSWDCNLEVPCLTVKELGTFPVEVLGTVSGDEFLWSWANPEAGAWAPEATRFARSLRNDLFSQARWARSRIDPLLLACVLCERAEDFSLYVGQRGPAQILLLAQRTQPLDVPLERLPLLLADFQLIAASRWLRPCVESFLQQLGYRVASLPESTRATHGHGQVVEISWEQERIAQVSMQAKPAGPPVLRLPVAVHLADNEDYPCSWSFDQAREFFEGVNEVFEPAGLILEPRLLRTRISTTHLERALPHPQEDEPRGGRKRESLFLQASENFEASTLNVFLFDQLWELGTRAKLGGWVAGAMALLSLNSRPNLLRHHCSRLARALGLKNDPSAPSECLLNRDGEGSVWRPEDVERVRARVRELLEAPSLPPAGNEPPLCLPLRVHLVMNEKHSCSWSAQRVERCFAEVNEILAQANVRFQPHVVRSSIATEALEAAFEHQLGGTRAGMDPEKLRDLPSYRPGMLNLYLLDACTYQTSPDLSWGATYSLKGIGVMSIWDGNARNFCVNLGMLMKLVPSRELAEPFLMNRLNRGTLLQPAEVEKFRSSASHWLPT